MGLRFLGSWAAFLALCARYAGRARPRARARLPVAALVAFPIAGLVATVGHLDDLRAGPAAGLARRASPSWPRRGCQRSGRRVEWCPNDAGWSSPVARRAHNPKVAGSNPAPATN